MQAIIYPNDQGGIAIILPAPDCGIPIQEIARKDVPFGVPYFIIDAALIPADRTYRDAWAADFSNPDGAGLGPHRWWIGQFTAEIARLEAQAVPEAKELADARCAAEIARLEAQAVPVAEGQGQGFEERRAAEIARLKAQAALEAEEEIQRFELKRAADIALLQARISEMKAQVFKIEGVQL